MVIQFDPYKQFISRLDLIYALSCLLGAVIALHLGAQLDHYRIEGVAARSGMASIFRSTDLRDGRQVAIKVPHPAIEADTGFLASFQREEQILKQLDHPGVMKVMSNDGRTQLYIVMEWVEGRQLRQVLRSSKKLPAERAVRIAFEICKTLAYVHGQGIVHRDLKPENVIVDAEGNITLIDFGIAVRAEAPRVPVEGIYEVTGSPDYIAPEQVRGEAGDGRSDLYALGVMLYEMLTGEVPFHGSTRAAIMQERLRSNPVPPRELDPEITPQLQEIIYRALERDPDKRYASARDFALDLTDPEAVTVADRPELSDWTPRRGSWVQKFLFGALLALIPAAIFTLVFFTFHWFTASPLPR